MRDTAKHRRTIDSRALLCAFLTLLLLTPVITAGPGKREWSLAPPVTLDFDMEDIPEPAERERSYYYDFLYSTFGLQLKESLDLPRSLRRMTRKPKKAYNVNLLGEVPDSSWYTNRNATRLMTLEEIRRGPNRGTGPAEGLWSVIQAKSEGITPGFLIRDTRGDLYQLKFDPRLYPEMATAAEVIASKLYYAAGYNVKENYIVRFHRERLAIDAGATSRDRYGRRQPMKEEDLDAILAKVEPLPDGAYRAVAGKYLDGTAKGPFPFEGVREDDPNDWIPHEHRRDLRGLRVFCSWVNENDLREGNTLDMYVEEDGRRFLRHYIIDLGSSLGSDTVHPNIDRIGNEYALDGREIAKSLLSFGLYRRPWTGSRKVTHFSVGFLESEIFDPGRWRANYPVLPFENMTLQDALWGARLVLSFTDEQILAAVETGEFSEAEAARFLAGVLMRRRDKIGRYWLSRVNPLDRFEARRSGEGEWRLTFRDLEVSSGLLKPAERSYEYSVARESGGGTLIPLRRAGSPSLELPLPARQASRSPGAGQGRSAADGIYRISLRSLRNGRPQGEKLEIYISVRDQDENADIAGVVSRGE